MRSTLLVEGVDDQEVIRQLLRHWGYAADPINQKVLKHPRLDELEVAKFGGYPKVLDELDVHWLSTDNNLGFVIDRDLDLAGQSNPWLSLRRRILEVIPQLGLQVPNEGDLFPKEGLVATHATGRRLGVWLMPDNQSLGMLETFVATLIPSTDRLWPQAQAAVNAIPEADRLFRHKLDKASIHTWLAWQAEPGIRMGTAINSKHFDHKSPSATSFVQWLEALIAPPQ